MPFSRKGNAIVLIDGGLGTTLGDYGLEIGSDPLWSGKILVQQPDQLARVHRDFVQATADIISTGTYQVSMDNLIKHYQLTSERAEEIIYSSVGIARKVIEDEKAQCSVAASIGPYGATLSDGSEFNGWYTNSMTCEQFKDWHRPRLAILARAEPDLVAFETIPSQREAEALVELLREFPHINAWLSFNCQDSKLTAHGERIEDAAASVCEKCPDQLLAIGVNCVDPHTVVPLMQRLQHLNRDLIAYPNTGVIWDAEKKQFNSHGQSIVPFVRSYLDANIKYIGGCCHVDPSQIRSIRKIIDDHSANS